MPCPKCNASDDLSEPAMPLGFVEDDGNRRAGLLIEKEDGRQHD
jgi:hypothetical protein